MTELTLQDPPAAPSAARPALTALIVLTGVFLSSLDLFIVNIAFPSISATYHGESLSSLSWVLSAYTIVFAAALVPAGRWADRAGRKKAFLLGLAVFTASSALCAVAPSLGLLVAARVLQASGGALMLPTSLGLLLPAFGPERQGGGHRPVVGRRRRGRRARPPDRRAARPGELALGVPGQPALQRGGADLRRSPAARGARPRGPQGGPARCGPPHGGGGQPGGGAGQGPDWGWSSPASVGARADGADRYRARAAFVPPPEPDSGACRHPPTGPWRWPTSAPSPSSAASGRSSSAASSS